MADVARQLILFLTTIIHVCGTLLNVYVDKLYLIVLYLLLAKCLTHMGRWQ